MDLPTYTSIWRIEKRLYKLYDFRLPMPVPVGQIAVFAAITVPYVILLTILGLPFNHTLFWLYVLPPGVITWLATRPVLESKRLPELVISQVRYLGEPGTWCRMAPLAEKDDVVVIGKVWRRDAERPRSPAEAPALAPAAAPAAPAIARRAARPRPAAARKAAAQAAPAGPRVRMPRAAPARQVAPAAQRRGRGPQWPGIAPGPAAQPPATAADTAADMVPAEIAHDERQAPLRPAAETGRHATRPAFPASGPGLGQDGATRPPRPDGLAAAVRPPSAVRPPAAAWPVKDPHAPSPPAVPDSPAWTPPGPPAPIPPARGDREKTAAPAVPAAAPAVPASGDPVPAAGDPVPVAGDPPPIVGDSGPPDRDSPVGRADSPAGPDTAVPAPPAGPVAGVPAQAAPPEPVSGPSTSPAGFFIGPIRPEATQPEAEKPEITQSEVAEAEAAQAEVAEAEVAEAEVAEAEVAEAETAQEETAESRVADPAPADHMVVEPETAEPETAEPETAEPQTAAEAEAAGPEVARPSAATPGRQAPPEGAPLAGPDLPDGDAPDQEPPGEPAEPAAGPPPAPANPWAPPIVVVRGGPGTRPTLVERALSGPGQHRGGSNWREHVRVVPGGHGPGRPDMERRDRARVLLPIHGPRLMVVLGCTVGAGQTVTTLMLGDVLASLRGEPVAALDLNPGQTSLADMARTSPAGTARGLLAGATPAVPVQRGGGRLDLIAHDSAPDDGQALADEEYARVIEILTSRYPLTLTDPGASAVARVLSAADQLILVAPASSDAARAAAMTMEWLDGHSYGELCTGAITVINGVSKRSMPHVEQAELVVRGRCRAIVRVPWDDHLGAPPAEQGISDAAAADTESRFAQLRPQVQHAYTALAGVLVSALAVGGGRMARTSGRTP